MIKTVKSEIIKSVVSLVFLPAIFYTSNLYIIDVKSLQRHVSVTLNEKLAFNDDLDVVGINIYDSTSADVLVGFH